MKPSYEELFTLVQQLSQANFELQQQNKRLLKKIDELEKHNAQLEERLGLNSKNSSKPPSSDQKANKRPSKGGAKKGHPGHYRRLLPEAQVDQKVVSRCSICKACGSEDVRSLKPWIFQQMELPEIKPLVTQIECEKVYCEACHKTSIASIPSEYEGVGFGPRLSSMIGMLSSVYRLGKRPVQSLLKSVFNIELSLGIIPRIESRLSEALAPVDQELYKAIASNEPAYIDETPFRENNKTTYAWTANTNRASLLRILPTRGLASLEQIRPRGHPGVTITDRYGAYRYKNHQYCLAHIKRDFAKYAKRRGEDGNLGRRLLYELSEVFQHAREYKKGASDLAGIKQRIKYRKNRMKQILEEVIAEGSDEFMGLAERLLDSYDKLFLFIKHPEIECTNNIAERALRHIVIWRKTSYGTQSEKGSRFLERTLSVWMTLKKQGRGTLEFFTLAYKSRINPALTPSIF